MTKFLSQALDAPEPLFSLSLRELERNIGGGSADIRLSNAVVQNTKTQLSILGLHPHDTTGRELYGALKNRLAADDAALHRALRIRAAEHVSAEGDLTDGIAHAVSEKTASQRSFALKSACFKSLVRASQPKKAMKLLGYRSLASFLKHEQPAAILAAMHLVESPAWLEKFTAKYTNCSPADFESRPLQIVHPRSAKWKEAGLPIALLKRQTIVALPELGAVFLLPLPREVPAGTATYVVAAAVAAANEVRAAGMFLALSVIKKDFGALVTQTARQQPALPVMHLNRPFAWQLVHRANLRKPEALDTSLFEPHLDLHDLGWTRVCDVLGDLHPNFTFWRNADSLGLLDAGKAVSMHVQDVALAVINGLAYERRVISHFQQELAHELELAYLRSVDVETAVLRHIQPQLAFEVATT